MKTNYHMRVSRPWLRDSVRCCKFALGAIQGKSLQGLILFNWSENTVFDVPSLCQVLSFSFPHAIFLTEIQFCETACVEVHSISITLLSQREGAVFNDNFNKGSNFIVWFVKRVCTKNFMQQDLAIILQITATFTCPCKPAMIKNNTKTRHFNYWTVLYLTKQY